ncbi:MAG: hypothetical protein WBG73_05925 [Coleofasciculaceae cyanobacterium]
MVGNHSPPLQRNSAGNEGKKKGDRFFTPYSDVSSNSDRGK